ncbi:MAG: type I-F CRISPR-associated protein Csy1 [Giesbergeria sp.]|uniref:type I-F CRISPR-associated protein Csy1 n=1 Tax=Giesbergeria sp. TaxID=2818473 RepID=UPI00262A8BF3|nr:type I-F CRISPR-associated protein Csy1 [Giesbergeria sp.]MDD2608454.1 type I-F CRISPR-associated protein Csy1 [Giesbergeria sp.]
MPLTERRLLWHGVIATFIQERLDAKLDKLKDDDAKRLELLAQHQYGAWIENAAKRVGQIQAVTHALKPIHPDARGTNLYVEPNQLPKLEVLGSHALGTTFAGDVVGNAAALDVYKFLRLELNGCSLLAALLAEDEAAMQALHDDPVQAQTLRDAFAALTQPRTGGPSSHPLAKQLYWLTDSDPCVDSHYELLAPLFPTSLAHVVHAHIQEHRFGEANKAARQAYYAHKANTGVFHHYPNLAVQKMGGTKPQNISQLNSERGGNNYLLASLPPTWRASAARLPVHSHSVFERLFSARPEVRKTLRQLRQFLASDPEPNQQTRQRRAAYIDTLIDEMVSLSGELVQTMPAGWTSQSVDTEDRFKELNRAEQLWLDPLRAQLPAETDFAQEWLKMDWPAEVGKRFANWLNHALKNQLPVGDAEAQQWQKALLVDEDGFKQQLRELRQRLDKQAMPEPGATL